MLPLNFSDFSAIRQVFLNVFYIVVFGIFFATCFPQDGINLNPSTVVNVSTHCITEDSRQGICVTYSTCFPNFTINPYGIQDNDTEIRAGSCSGRYEWCCTEELINLIDKNFPVTEKRPGGSQTTSTPPTNESTPGNENRSDPKKPTNSTAITGCGVTETAYEDNANFFRSGECPWCVAIYRTGGNPSQLGPNGYWCAGALIHERVVLTSAACAHIAKKSQLTVNVGETDLSNNERRGSQEKKVVNYHLHPDYKSGTKANDLGLLILESPIEVTVGTGVVGPTGLVCLPTAEMDAISTCSAGGWGPTTDGKYKNLPINMRLTGVDKVSCESWYRQNGASSGFTVRDDSFCAQRTVDTDTCPVARGAPFFCTSEKLGKRYVLQGIGSSVLNCKDTTAPAIFAKVAHSISWIKDEITKLT